MIYDLAATCQADPSPSSPPITAMIIGAEGKS